MKEAVQYRLPIRIYLEDTDAQGIVYHANYLKYFERARSEIFESLGIGVGELSCADRRYVVYEIRVKFRRTGSLGDRMEVVSFMQRASDYRLTFHQEARRAGEATALASAEVDVVCIDRQGKLVEIPLQIASAPG